MAILNNSNAISSGGYDINNSLRTRSSASAYLSRTPASAGNRRTYTWSAWVKRGALNGGGSDMCLFNAGTTSPNYDGFRIKSDTISFYQGGAVSVNLESTQVFRDVSAWYHLVLAVDTTQATAANRVKIYVNGNQVTAFGTANYPSLNAEAAINNTLVHNIAAQYANTSSSSFFDGYMADINFIDGSAKTPSDFGETDTTTGVWKPKAYTSTYGTNGFYLKFSDIATTSGSNAGLGKDFSGNTNYWTTNNISVTAGTTYDAMTDSPTLTSATVANYATLNPLDKGAVTLANANLNIIRNSSTTDWEHSRATIQIPSTGKWYFEMVFNSGSTDGAAIGVCTKDFSLSTDFAGGTYANAYAWLTIAAILYANSSASYGTSPSSGDVIMCAFDRDNSTLYFGRNGTWFNSSNPATGTSPAISSVEANVFPFFGARSTANAEANFGQRPFAYTPPTGFVRLNTYNLPDSTVKKGNSYFDAVTYNGSNSNLTVTNAGSFQPDLVWAKSRSGAYNNILVDAIRGGNLFLSSNTTSADTTSSGLATFTSSGITWIGGASGVNASGDTYVDWMWKGGNGTSSNTSGTITSTVSVNTTAGFSVATYTGTGTAATIGHGLGVAPKFYIVKRRNGAGTDYWCCYHISIGATKGIYLNTQDAAGTSDLWNDTAPTSTVFSVKTTGGVNASGGTYVAYCWAEIAGFSKFGSYTGNSNADGPFVYTGFRPKFVMIKTSNLSGENWAIWDTSRNTYNVANLELFANASNAEVDGTGRSAIIDSLSNGFKIRGTNPEINDVAGSYIYMAFAENPFKNALAR